MSDDICITVNGIDHSILCGFCNAPISFIGETDGHSGNAGCEPCGSIEDIQEVARLAVEYAKDEGQLMLNRMARDAARGSKIMTFSGKTEHDQVHRFIVELKI